MMMASDRKIEQGDRRKGMLMIRSLTSVFGCLCALPVLAQTSMPMPPEVVQVDGNGVDVVSGQVMRSITPLSIGSAEYGLSLTMAFGSENLRGMLEVLRHGLLNTETSISASWDNKKYSFPSNGFSTDRHVQLSQTIAGVEYKLTLADGTVVTYRHLDVPDFNCGTTEPCGTYFYPTRVDKPNGLVILVHYATWTGTTRWQVRIQSVTNNAGYQIKFNYLSNTATDAASGAWMNRVSAVAINNAVEYCDPHADTCSLSQSWPTAYFQSTRTTTTPASTIDTVTDSAGRVTRSTYVSPPPGGGASYLKIKTPANPDDNIVYTYETYSDPFTGGLGTRVKTVASEAGTWTYTYSNPPTSVTVKGLDGKETVYGSVGFGYWSSLRLLSSIKNPLNQTVTFDYNCTGTFPGYFWLTSTSAYDVTMPEGNVYKTECDARGNVTKKTRVPKASSGQSSVWEMWGYPAAHPGGSCLPGTEKICNKPITYTDAKQAVTDYVFDSVHGGLKMEKLPAVNGVRPVKSFGYLPLSAYVKNAAGNLVPATCPTGSMAVPAGTVVPCPIYVPTTISECRTSAYVETTGSCATTGDDTVTTYEYGATETVNRLLVRGQVVTSGGVSLRTCYSYDRLGNRISETTPRAGLASCL